MISVQEMQESDSNAIISQIICAYPTWLHDSFDVVMDLGLLESLTKRCRHVLSDQFNNTNTCFGGYILKNDTDIIGHIWLYQQENDTTGKMQAQILSIYIRPDYRGKWFHKRLIETAELWAKDRGCCALSGMVVNNNLRALKSAAREGFTATRYEIYKPL